MLKLWTDDLVSLKIKSSLYLDTLRCCQCIIVTPLVAYSYREAFSRNHLSCMIDSDGRLACYRLLWIDLKLSRVRYLLLHVYTWFMMLSWIYLGHSGNTVLISNLQFETKSGRKRRETIYRENLIIDSLKVISRW